MSYCGQVIKWIRRNTNPVIAIATIIIAGTGIFQLITFNGQLNEMKSSSAQTDQTIGALKNQVGIMQKQLQQSQTSNEMQLRAYVMGEQDTFYGDEHHPHGVITIKNYGQTPAYNVNATVAMYVLPIPLPNSADIEAIPNPIGRPPSQEVLGPSQSVVIQTMVKSPISDKEAKEIIAGSKAIYFFGNINYADAFGVSRHTTFHYDIEGPDAFKDGTHPLSRYPYGNDTN